MQMNVLRTKQVSHVIHTSFHKFHIISIQIEITEMTLKVDQGHWRWYSSIVHIITFYYVLTVAYVLYIRQSELGGQSSSFEMSIDHMVRFSRSTAITDLMIIARPLSKS